MARAAGPLQTVGKWISASAAFALVVLFAAYVALPDVRPLAAHNPPTTAFIELRASEALSRGQRPKRVQYWVAYSRISPNLKRAVLVAEDSAFWKHEGIDVGQLRESMELDFERMEFARGASTITQQLAKNLYLSPRRDPLRKFRELLLARDLEAALSKRRILELYLNVIEWGEGIFGAEAASRAYFGVPASTLTPDQAALLAGAIINPRRFNPGAPNRRLLARQRLILRRMGAASPPPEVASVPSS
jgi:monofunctional biosynthetic peptidoglycan transglycosylase